MTRLSHIQNQIDEAAFAPEAFDENIATLARALGYDHGALVYSELEAPNYVATEQTLAGLKAYAEEGWLQADYRARFIDPFPLGRIFVDNLEVPDALRRKSDIYNSLYRKHDMSYFAGWKFVVDDTVWIYSFARGEKREAITREEMRLLQRMGRAANRSAVVAQKLRSARVAGMLEGLASVGVAALTLSQSGRVLRFTPQAEQVFDAQFGPVRGILRAVDRASQVGLDELSALVRAPLGGRVLDSVVVRRTDGRRPILIEPVPVRGLGLDGFPGARLLLLLIDLDQPTGRPERQLIQLFDLSPAEADIAVRLSQGLDARAIAAARNVQVGTVRVQIKHLLEKLHAGRQADIVRMVSRLSGTASAGAPPERLTPPV